MPNFNHTQLSKIAIHKVGNAAREEGVQLSDEETPIEEDLLKDVLKSYLLNPFSEVENYYRFHHETDLAMNEVFQYASKIFENPEELHQQSINIARHLYECSKHPQIKTGELYIVFFENCMMEDEVADAIGIFKSENKDTFLRILPTGGNFEISQDNGINIKKLDKGCLIFNTEEDSGFKVAIVDTLNKKNEAQYWIDDFLNLEQKTDDFYYTQKYMDLCRGFAQEITTERPEVSKTEQAAIINKSLDFFAENESFEIAKFENEVIQEPEMIAAFQDYTETFKESKQVVLEDNFDIAEKVVKQEKKKFKSVLKLDKNFHIYIHGKGQEYMQKGFDEAKQMSYYTLYFGEEK